MLTRRRVLFRLAWAAVFLGAAPAWATIDNLKSYKQAYPGKEPKAYSCKTCHENPIGKKGDLNAYGKALQQFKAEEGAKKLTVEDFQAVDQDPDADGASTLDELQAGTDPNDPASVPAADDASSPPSEPEVKPSSRYPAPDASGWTQVRSYLTGLTGTDAWAEETAQSEAQSKANSQAKAEYVGTETCAACHAKQYEEFKHSTHARIAVPGDQAHAQGCEMCHGPGSLHVEAGGGRGVGGIIPPPASGPQGPRESRAANGGLASSGIINPRKDPSTCFECHLDKKAEFRLPYHHPVMEGKMSCSDCHSAHGQEVRPWSATTLKGINEACFKCHKDQRGPFVNEHEALREGCTTCHKVHGSIHEKMLLVRDANLCLRCHTQTNFPTIGGSGHGSRLNQGTCFSAGCHTAVHGSNFDEHLRY